jgi:bifunctional DNase/RNase
VKLVDLVGLHVEASSGTPLIIMREHEPPFRVVPIVIGGAEATSIAVALSGQPPPRPLSHDLMAALVTDLGARVDRLEVTAMSEGAFLAELAVSGPNGPRRLDARPSDGIALAVRVGAPLYVSEDVLDQAGAVLVEQPGEQAIDDAVDEFRSYLEGLDPDALSAALGEPLDGPPGTEQDDEPPDGS